MLEKAAALLDTAAMSKTTGAKQDKDTL